MNATTTTSEKITPVDFDKITPFPTLGKHVNENELPAVSSNYDEIKEDFTEQIASVCGGEHSKNSLLLFCEELSELLVRSFMIEDHIDGFNEVIRHDLMKRLNCTAQQADCLIELSLELIHIDAHGEYRHQPTNIDLRYLISMAATALNFQYQ